MHSFYKQKNPIYIRLFVLFILCLEAATLKGYTPFGTEGLTWFWVVYISCYYLILYELPLFCLRNSAYRQLFVPAGWLVALNIFFDGLGCLLNLFAKFQHYDTFMHISVFPWAITAITLSLGMIYCQKNRLSGVPRLPLILGFLGAMTIMSIHEVVELGIDWLSGTNSGTGATEISDTGCDLLCDLIGASTFILLFWLLRKKQT